MTVEPLASVRPAHVMPLENFPEWKQREIAEAVAQPRPPEKWLAMGSSTSPRPLAFIHSRAWYEWHYQRGIDPDKRRQPIPRWLRQAVIERDGLTCQLCGAVVDGSDVHIDHRVPYSSGGSTDLDNLQVAHSRCNLLKGARA